MTESKFADAYTMGNYRYVIMVAVENGKLLWCRQKGKTTWEIPGGHIESGESPEAAACRELFEETGAEAYSLSPLFDYWAGDEEGGASGVVFLADVTERGLLPDSEMEEVRPADNIPGEWSWPEIQPCILEMYKKMFGIEDVD